MIANSTAAYSTAPYRACLSWPPCAAAMKGKKTLSFMAGRLVQAKH
jgi:hypothetical protein